MVSIRQLPIAQSNPITYVYSSLTGVALRPTNLLIPQVAADVDGPSVVDSMREFVLWLRRFCMASLDLNCSFQRRNTALTILDAMAAKLAPVWETVYGTAFVWEAEEVACLLALFRDAFDINRLAAFNLLQRVSWPLDDGDRLVSLLQQGPQTAVDEHLAMQAAEPAASDGVPGALALFHVGFRASSQMSHAASNSGALVFALLFAQVVQGRRADNLPATLGRSEKMSYLQKTVENISTKLDQADAAKEATFIATLFRILELRVRKLRVKGGLTAYLVAIHVLTVQTLPPQISKLEGRPVTGRSPVHGALAAVRHCILLASTETIVSGAVWEQMVNAAFWP